MRFKLKNFDDFLFSFLLYLSIFVFIFTRTGDQTLSPFRFMASLLESTRRALSFTAYRTEWTPEFDQFSLSLYYYRLLFAGGFLLGPPSLLFFFKCYIFIFFLFLNFIPYMVFLDIGSQWLTWIPSLMGSH